MEKTENTVSDVTDHVEEFLDTWYKLSLLNLTQKTTTLASAGITVMVIFISGFFVLLLGGVALSLWLGNLVDNRAAGFLLGAAFFILVMLVVILLRKKIVFPYFRNLIIRKLYDNS